MKKKENLIISSVSVLVAVIILGICFDYFYDLNDDVLIKDILSGAYSGTPSAFNNQNLWLFGALLSILYRIVPVIPWYGLILIIFQFGSLLIIEDRTLELIDYQKVWVKIVTAVSETALLISLMLNHLINVQYTLTVAFMAGAAIMWLLSSNSGLNPKEFVKSNIPTVVILFLAFNLRSEMLLLMLPFVCVAGFFKWSYEKKIFTKTNLLKYLCTLSVIIGTLVISIGINRIAYSGEGWQKFCDFFDARTELYDFQVIPSYEGNEDFYNNINISSEEQILFENYNFGIDEKITSDTVWEIADYADSRNPKNTDTVTKLKENIKLYIYQLTHGEGPGTDYPWNIAGFALYLMAIALILGNKKTVGFLNLLVLFAGRTVIWLYMMMGNRMPDRITHSLYFVEICLLIGIILLNVPRERTNPVVLCAVIAGLLTFIALPGNWEALRDNQNQRLSTEEEYISLYTYTSEHEDSYYLMDVYSSVAYSERVFGPMKDVTKKNLDIMGGWICFSPIQEEKEKAYGISDMESALQRDNVFFVCDNNQSTEWLPAYYGIKGRSVMLTPYEETQNGRFGIYRVEDANGING